MTQNETRALLNKINSLWPGKLPKMDKESMDKMVIAWTQELSDMPVETVRRSFRHYMDDPEESGDFPPTVKKLKKHAPITDEGWRKTQAYWDEKYVTDPAYRAMKDEYRAKAPDRFVTLENGRVRYSNEH
jgi:hypothetical protein